MIAANGLILLSQGELSLQPANTSGASYYTDAAIEVRWDALGQDHDNQALTDVFVFLCVHS